MLKANTNKCIKSYHLVNLQAVMPFNVKTMEGENNAGWQENKRKGGVDSASAFFNEYLTNPLWTMMPMKKKNLSLGFTP